VVDGDVWSGAMTKTRMSKIFAARIVRERNNVGSDSAAASKRDWLVSVAGAALLLMLSTAAAAPSELRGAVHDDAGTPIAGAIVSFADDTRGVTENVYTDASGRFRLVSSVTGDISVRIRKPYFDDLRADVHLTGTSKPDRDFTLVRTVSDKAISDSLPAAYHFGQISFQPGTRFARDLFQRECLSCHQLGNAFTRKQRSIEEWEAVVQRMHGLLGDTDPGLRKQRAELLTAGFNDTPVMVRPNFPFDPLIAEAKVVEYRLDKALVPHDAEIGPRDGLIYTVDQEAELMAVTDPKTGKTDYYPAPHDDMPLGGKFVRMGLTPPFYLYRGPHSLAIGPDDKWYVTDSIAGQIGVFNSKTMKWEKSFEIPGKTLYPHTIRLDASGIIWFTIILTDQIGRLDPKTGDIKVIPLPSGQSKSISPLDMPYGIDVSPKDGSVWYAKIMADRIGRVDPVTLTVEEWDSPIKGPRRLRFDRAGSLWVTGYSEGKIAALTPSGFGFSAELFDMPEFAAGYRPAPYALGVDPKTQEIWVNETVTDHLYRFIPKEKRWVAYPMPLRGTFTREITFTGDGTVCTSNSNIPVAAIEGGAGELICIEPNARAN
jgi:streptogramin lyase